ncbi:hypothetical protein DOZ69_24670 [Pseudomonas fluorescens]|nr:hypothetical protein DOZ69_24670 [Pseudomonas fluorescens]
MIAPTPCRDDRSHALRGNASRDAPRSSSGRDAERPGLHSHAERGNESWRWAVGGESVVDQTASLRIKLR